MTVVIARAALAGVAAGTMLLAGLSGCGDSAAFTLGRDFNVCDENLPTACALAARCVLDPDHYIAGTFPSARRFVARTKGDATLRISLLLTVERAPGTELQLIVHEPSCADRVTWDSAGQDLFRLTGSDGVLEVPIHVVHPGDHLVELVSDAYCDYSLKLDL